MTTALASGGRDFFGWGLDRYMAADLYDALNMNTVATGQWKKKPPKIDPYPRPKPPKVERDPSKPVSVLDLFGQFAGMGAVVIEE